MTIGVQSAGTFFPFAMTNSNVLTNSNSLWRSNLSRVNISPWVLKISQHRNKHGKENNSPVSYWFSDSLDLAYLVKDCMRPREKWLPVLHRGGN